MGKRQFRTRGRGFSRRKVGQRELIHRFLIVCEGEKSEPTYFRSFRVPSLVMDIHGLGANTLGLVKAAVDLSTLHAYDQVWCVFDRDSFPPENFNSALSLARSRGFQVAYSNEAFELWYLLHFEYCDAALSRQTYSQRLSGYLGYRYEKNSERVVAEILPYSATAIRNASRLLATYEPTSPVRDNPSTTIHLLVQELQKYEQR